MAVWHLLTPEFAPQGGGVADYTRLVAQGLAEAGDEVHVWCPPAERENTAGVVVHQTLGAIGPADLRRVGRELDAFAPPRHLLVQWVPHGFGWRAMNLPLCIWLWWRARVRGDLVDVMVHEPYLAFREHRWRHAAVALVHRLMTIVLLHAARRVWIAIPAWETRWRPYALGRQVPFAWLPVPSSLPKCPPCGAAAAEVRARYADRGRPLVGHFGTYGPAVAALLMQLVPAILDSRLQPAILLVGAGSEEFRRQLAAMRPDLGMRAHAAGRLPLADVAAHLAACDLLVQPYPDGISTRRTSAMAGLALGRPMVTTRGPLTEPLWHESGAVVLTDGEDPVRFVAHVEGLLDHEVERQRLGARARTLYAERFDLRHTIAALSAGDVP
ncbi:MAG: glycosyltransferase family 4 protein [Gemmatimonadetes bacterium]|nr:glycosyltransferase family 4 protein [Gemmatimonadota bacterium]